MRIKGDVDVRVLSPQMVLAAIVVESVFKEFGVDAEITSGNEGTHPGKPVAGDDKDPHYTGHANDYGVKRVAPERRQALFDELVARLGPQFVVRWEARGTPEEHVHIQFGHVAVEGAPS